MKTIVLTIIMMCVSIGGFAQDKGIKTVTISVKGNCEDCKKRIENAADIKGVKLAEWDENAQALTVTYKADKVTLEKIEAAVAASGHDTKNSNSTTETYNKLPSCCQYRDQKCEPHNK